MKNSLHRLRISFFVIGSLFVSNISFAQCSTSSTPTNTCSYGDLISSFSLGGTSATGNSGCGINGYNSFTKPVFSLQQGQSYLWSALVGSGTYTQCFAIWIDLDNNGVYDKSEMLVNSSAAFSHAGSLTIPLTATAASNIHMRIRCAYTTSGTLWNGTMACTNNVGGYGETEDYLVDISCASLSQPAATSPVTVCTGQQASLTASTSTGTLTWYTSSSGGSSVGTGSPFTTSIISSSTSYYVAAETPGCSSSRKLVAVTAHQNPVISLGGNITACDTITLNAGNPGCTYWWSGGITTQTKGFIASEIDTVMVTDSLGCYAITSVGVTIHPSPIVYLGNHTSCGGLTLDAGNSGCTYLWSTGATTQYIFASTSQTYTVSVTNSYGCTGYGSSVVTVNPVPTVNLGADATVTDSITLDAGNPGCSYLWSGGDTTRTHWIWTTQTDTVAVTNSYGCVGVDDITITIEYSGGRMANSVVSDTACCGTSLAATGQLELYPNPGNGKLNVSFNSSHKGNMQLTIVSMNGQLVYSESIDNFNGIYSKLIDLSNGPKGLYLVRINIDKQLFNGKINVQ